MTETKTNARETQEKLKNEKKRANTEVRPYENPCSW
jgi:hypothetical protein